MKTRVGRWAPMLIVPVMALSLVGCSGDDDNDDDDSADPSQAPSSATTPAAETTTPTTVSPELPTPPRLRGSTGGVNDVDYDPTSCKTDEGTQTVEGEVTNPSRQPIDYVITISWTNATSDVLGLGFATVEDVPSRETRPWTLRAKVPDNASQCVINVTRGQLATGG